MALGFDELIRGVNLGNWLVLERWMTPGLFRASGEADEIWMHRTMPSDELDRLLRRHRETYVTLDDFRAIAAYGCNLVRIPVPYFIFGDVLGHPGCVKFLDRAFDWANAVGLKVLIDLHTVPGSQNGYDNGGLTGVCRWHRSPKAVGFALDVLTRLAARYRDNPALFGIEVLNEPVSWLVYRTASSTGAARDAAEAHGSGHVPMRFLKAFYRESYHRLRGVLRPETVIMFHDGFRLGAWGDWFVREGMHNVMLDTHIYLVGFDAFSPVHTMRAYRAYLRWNEWRIRRAVRHTSVVVGEWSLANAMVGRAAGRAAGRVEPSERQSAEDRIYRDLAAMQRRAWDAGAGHIFWSYQLRRLRDGSGPRPGREPWSLSDAWRNGWISGLNAEGR